MRNPSRSYIQRETGGITEQRKCYTKPFAKACEHFAEFSSDHRFRVAYTTPECLVNLNDKFYDPCRCMDCTGDSSVLLDLLALVANPACRIRFDPRCFPVLLV